MLSASELRQALIKAKRKRIALQETKNEEEQQQVISLPEKKVPVQEDQPNKPTSVENNIKTPEKDKTTPRTQPLVNNNENEMNKESILKKTQKLTPVENKENTNKRLDITSETKKLEKTPNIIFKIFVGGLGSDITEKQLKEIFEQYPSFIGCEVIRDKYSQTLKYGFLSFSEYDDYATVFKDFKARKFGIGHFILKPIKKPDQRKGRR